MSSLNKLLGLSAIGATIAKTRLIKRFVGELAHVVSLAIATGFMMGALLIGGLYVAYQALVRYGLEPFAAEVLIAAVGAIILAILYNATNSCLRRLKNIPQQIVHEEFPLSSRMNGLVDSFMDGLLASPADQRPL